MSMIRYGHIHFQTHTLASEFFHKMREMTYMFGLRKVQFSAAKYFNSKNLVNYLNQNQVCPPHILLFVLTF